MMSEKLYEIKQNSDGKYWLFNNDRNSCLMISENIASLLDICTVLNEQSDTIQGLLLDRNRQEEKLDIARRNLSKQLEKIDEQQSTITELAKKWRVLSQENMQLKDYIDTIFEDNTHICKYLDVEDVQFYCDKNKNYRNPSCLYEKCFDEENLIKIKDEIRRVLE